MKIRLITHLCDQGLDRGVDSGTRGGIRQPDVRQQAPVRTAPGPQVQ